MAGLGWLRTGTITVTNGSKAVTGTDTIWGGGVVNPGDIILLPNGALGEVESVGSNTALTLKLAYTGATASAQPYAIIRMLPSGNVAADLAAALQALIQRSGSTLDQLFELFDSYGAVSFSDGTTTLSGLHGLRKLMADIAARPAYDTAGNVGVGAVPSSWGADFRAIDIGDGSRGAAVLSGFYSLTLARNCFRVADGWRAKYTAVEPPSAYVQPYAGGHEWLSASGPVTAGEAVALQKVMALTSTGALSVTGPVRPGLYTLGTLPSASAYPQHIIVVTDASGGAAQCLSNGASWINIRTNAPVN